MYLITVRSRLDSLGVGNGDSCAVTVSSAIFIVFWERGLSFSSIVRQILMSKFSRKDYCCFLPLLNLICLPTGLSKFCSLIRLFAYLR